MGNLADILSMMDNVFRYQKPRGQFLVVSRRAHGYGDASPTHTDFQWFFGSHSIRFSWLKASFFPALNFDCFGFLHQLVLRWFYAHGANF